jgi:class 3 adenylate cyclase
MEAEAPLRRPMALLFCDIAGSTRLVAQEGDLVAATVFREFREQAGGLAREHHCSMIKFLGDAFQPRSRISTTSCRLWFPCRTCYPKTPHLLDD